MTDNFAKELAMVSDMKSVLADTPVKLKTPPKPVGYWAISKGSDGYCIRFAAFKKPTDEQIKNHAEMLGWEWEDAT